MKDSYDVAIIGAGTAGLTARMEVSKKTDNYVVVDGGALGTTCARVGCMPSKALIEIAGAYHSQLLLRTFGITESAIAPADIGNVMRHVRRLRDRFVGGVKKDMDSWKKHLKRKNARFVDAHTLDLGDEIIVADRIIIATGSKPIVPEEWKKYGRYLIDTDRLFELETVPGTLAVFGLGPNGIELGQALARLGIDVIAVTPDKAIGGLTDPEVQEHAFRAFSDKMKIRIGLGEILGESDGGLKVACNNESWTVDRVLLAVGRRPAIADLGLENLGVPLDDRGMPPFNENTLQIEDLPVFIAGDANEFRPFLHEASDEGRIAGYNAVSGKGTCFRRRVRLGIVFSDPNIAVIGGSHASLTRSATEFAVGESNYEHSGRAMMTGRNEGLVRLYAAREDGLILGAELVAPQGEHLAHLISWTIGGRLHASDVLTMPFYHPVVEEGLRRAFREAADKSAPPKPESEMLLCEDAIVG